jgi:hypothetical protein
MQIQTLRIIHRSATTIWIVGWRNPRALSTIWIVVQAAIAIAIMLQVIA